MPSSLRRSRQLLLLCLLLARLCTSSGRGYDEHFPPVTRQESYLPMEEVQTGQCNKTVAIYEDVSTPSVTAETYNKPLTCWYEFRPNGAPSSDYVIDIRFKTFNVGRVHNSTTCRGGYVQIIDGNDETEVTNHISPGFFCGEMQNSKNFISETNSVKLIFHAENFTEGTYLSFFSRTELTRALHKRYGKQPELYPGGRRGDPVGPNSYCERVFSRCRTDSCFVQSPAYPGPYPRNLHCRYHLNVESSYIRLYTADQQVSIDGQRCDSPMICPLRPLTSEEGRCTRDFITIYDGKNEIDPKIGTFCGFGRFPHSITGSGTDLLVTFISSPAGPLLNEGFQFSVGSVPGKRETQGKLSGLCDWVFGARRLRRSGLSSGQFSSLAHWYPANTTCRHLIRADSGMKVRLRFTSFRVDPITAPLAADDGDCAESLAVYDAAEPRSDRLLRLYCDTFSAPAKSEPIMSSGRAMLVLFTSRTGSFEASSLFYRATFDFFREAWWGLPVPDTRCDETFPSWHSESGEFGGPQNRLVFEDGNGVRCRYTFKADPRRYARLLVNITELNLKERCQTPPDTETCRQAPSHITSVADASDAASLCACRPGHAPRALLTSASELSLELSVSATAGRHALSDGWTPLMSGTYQFVHGPFCGATEATGDRLQYPALDFQPREPTYCVWEVAVGAGHDLWFQVREFRLEANCSSGNVRIYTTSLRLLLTLCSGAEGSSHSIPAADIASGRVWIHFASQSPNARFLVQWARVAAAGGAPATSQLVAARSASSSASVAAAGNAGGQTTPPPVLSQASEAVSRWREIGMLGGAVTTLVCLVAVAVWWCRRRRRSCSCCWPPPAPEERCLTSEAETSAEEPYTRAGSVDEPYRQR